MINKGELYMEHENVDENARYLAACENVKKIVNAIKSIKIKYYPNFAKISEEDKKVYDELELNLEKISEDNNLNRLKTALMEEVSAKYDKKDMKNEPRDPKFLDNGLLACYGAIDAQQKALSQGKISQAKRCQNILKQYMKEIDSIECRKLIINYKREKFGELIRNREEVQKKNENAINYMKRCYEPEYVLERQHAKEQIEVAKNKSMELFNKAKLNTEELVIG